MTDFNSLQNRTLHRTVNAIPDVFVGATFFEIKQSIINWLSSQDEFRDFMFEGSRINVLIDLLAYNTLYMQQFANTAMYESFLGTANLRSSVIQAAQDNSYLPSSASCAETSILLKLSHALNPTSVRIPRGTKFLAYAKNTSVDPYTFVVLEDVVAVRDSENKYNPLLKLAQGRIIRTQRFFDADEKIILKDDNIDRDAIRVYVDGAEWTNWTRKSIVGAGSTSSIFYLRETLEGCTEVYFGEGEQSVSVAGGALQSNYIGGLKPLANASIAIEYIVTSGSKANGAKGFSYADTIQHIKIEQIIENPYNSSDYVGADGGGDVDDIERIRELAQVKRESQMRCVTASDYNAFISEKFGSIVQAVQTFTDPEKPGYAFISIKPKSGLTLTQVQKEDIEQYLKGYNLAPITPSVMSPDYMFIEMDIDVTYSMNRLKESEEHLKSLILNKINRYYTEEVEIFNKGFAKSKLLSYIDIADKSIVGSTCQIKLVKEIDNFMKTPEAGIRFNNAFNVESIDSAPLEFRKAENDDYYSVSIFGVLSNEEDQMADIVIGPFNIGDVVETQHISKYDPELLRSRNEVIDFDETTKSYYKIGETDAVTNKLNWDITSIGLKSNQFSAENFKISVKPLDDNIFPANGSLIVFENDLRPDYTKINLKGLAQ